MTTDHDKPSNIFQPPRALSRKTAEPIIYLATRMSQADSEAVRRESRMIEMIADAVGYEKYRHEKWFKEMTEEEALRRINTDLAKKATLVVLSLVLKADVHRKDAEHDYFTWVREQLGADPITVPVDLEEHRLLALKYFID